MYGIPHSKRGLARILENTTPSHQPACHGELHSEKTSGAISPAPAPTNAWAWKAVTRLADVGEHQCWKDKWGSVTDDGASPTPHAPEPHFDTWRFPYMGVPKMDGLEWKIPLK